MTCFLTLTQGRMGLCVLGVHGHTLQGNHFWFCRAISKSLQGNLKNIERKKWWGKNLGLSKWFYFIPI
jgi:hypothetical protein